MPSSPQMWYDPRSKTAGWERRLRENPRNIPSLYFLACRALLKTETPMLESSRHMMDYLVEQHDNRNHGAQTSVPGLEIPSLILENRRPPEESLYLTDPARFNPCQWHIVYTERGGPTNGVVCLINRHLWHKPHKIDLGVERVNQILNDLREAIDKLPQAVMHEETVWLNDADMNLQLDSDWIQRLPGEPDQSIICLMKAEEDRKKRAKTDGPN